ncbi:hypothetical protein J6590_031976 [Homalodisca vitripennis]|nr:hypothetical protein J6590_031976 [Homalodisca vitripennis]
MRECWISVPTRSNLMGDIDLWEGNQGQIWRLPGQLEGQFIGQVSSVDRALPHTFWQCQTPLQATGSPDHALQFMVVKESIGQSYQ